MNRSSYAIFVRDMTLDLVIGIYEHELTVPQRVGVNLEIEMAESYDSDSFLNYDHVVDFLTKDVPKQRYPLQEDLAGHIRDFLMGFAQVSRAEIEVSKPDAYGKIALAGVRLVVTRS